MPLKLVGDVPAPRGRRRMVLCLGRYVGPDGPLAVLLQPPGGEQAFCEDTIKVSVNVAEYPEIELGPGEFVVSHDFQETDGLRQLAEKLGGRAVDTKAARGYAGWGEALLGSGLVADTGRRCCYGFVEDQPIWRVKAVVR